MRIRPPTDWPEWRTCLWWLLFILLIGWGMAGIGLAVFFFLHH